MKGHILQDTLMVKKLQGTIWWGTKLWY